jgi:hypothetical protein
LPGALKKKMEELRLQTLVRRLEEAVEEKRKRDAKRKKEDKTVLTRRQEIGKRSLLRRQEKKELVLLETDKSGKVTAVHTERFIKKMHPHMEHDVDIVRKEKKWMSRFALIIARILRVGEDYGQEDRVATALRSHCSKILALDGMF